MRGLYDSTSIVWNINEFSNCAYIPIVLIHCTTNIFNSKAHHSLNDTINSDPELHSKYKGTFVICMQYDSISDCILIELDAFCLLLKLNYSIDTDMTKGNKKLHSYNREGNEIYFKIYKINPSVVLIKYNSIVT